MGKLREFTITDRRGWLRLGMLNWLKSYELTI